MSNAIIGYGFDIDYSANSDMSGSVAVAECTEVNFDDFTIEEVDVTNTDSSGGFREYTFGFGNPGSFSFSFNYYESQFNALYALARTTKYWRITFADSSKFVGQGYITSLNISCPVDDRMVVECTVRWIAKPTFTVV